MIDDRYELLNEAGSGGMATVWRARDVTTGEPVAIKVLRLADRHHVARFQREVAVLADVRHPNIVHYRDDGVLPDGRCWLAMEWLDGQTLADRLRQQGPLPVVDALTVVRQVASALTVLHDRGLVHRDLKPQNLFLVGGGVADVRVLDFGLARTLDASRVTSTGAIVGTPAYMSPEQATGAEVGPASDVFSLGAVLYEMLCGAPPFGGARALAVLAKIVFEDAPPLRDACPTAPRSLERLVALLLAKDASLRPRDAGQLLLDLDLAGLDSDASRTGSAGGQSITTGERRFFSVVCVSGDADADTVLVSSAPTRAMGAPEDGLADSLERLGARLVSLAEGSQLAVLGGEGQPAERAFDALRCAARLQEAAPGRVVSVATGWGRLGGGSVPVGDVLERAVGLTTPPDDEPPGRLRVDAVTAGLLAGRIAFTAPEREGEAHLVDAELVALAARRPDLAHGTDERLLLGRPSPFVGRRRELELLLRQWSDALGDEAASAALVVGAAGLGKSRLLAELLDRLEPTPETTLVARGEVHGLRSPFALIAGALRRHAGLHDAPADAAARRAALDQLVARVDEAERLRVRTFLAVLVGLAPEGDAGALAAARQDALLMRDQLRSAWLAWLEAELRAGPLLLVLEDVHWADEASLALVDAALGALDEHAWMVVGLGRPETVERFPHLWSGRGVVDVRLAPLRKRAARQLVDDTLGDTVADVGRDALVELAGGNAFYLEELVRAHARGDQEGLPDTVLSMAQHRLDQLDPEARRVLRAGAIFGRRFTLDAVVHLTGGTARRALVARWLESLAREEVVSSTTRPVADAGGPGYQFRHDLLREAAYAMLTDDDRATGHRLAADWLARTPGSEAARIAEHRELAGQLEEAVTEYLRAARAALGRSDVNAAHELAGAGARCGAVGEALGALRLLQARAAYWRDAPEDQRRFGAEAAERLPAGSADQLRAQEEHVIALGRLHLEPELRALAPDLVALEHADTEGIGPLVRVLARGVIRVVLVGAGDLAPRLLERMEEVAARAHQLPPGALALSSQAWAVVATYIERNPGSALVHEELAAEELRRASDARGLIDQLANLSYSYALLGCFEKAESAAREALDVALRLDIPSVEGHACHNLGPALAGQGRLDEAREAEARAVEWFGAHGDVRLDAGSRVYLADIEAAAGRPAEALELATSAVELLDDVPGLRAWALAVAGDQHRALGDGEAALAATREAMALLAAEGGIEHGELRVRVAHADALAAAGEEEAAAEIVRGCGSELEELAARITDAALRASYLERVPEHARIVARAEALELSRPPG